MQDRKFDNVFERCRAIPASEAARREGLQLQKRGAREWVRCPFHQEKTASLAFDEHGRFYCFGCKVHGDAVAFLAKLHDLNPLQAAYRLLEMCGGADLAGPAPPAANSRERELIGILAPWHAREWDGACTAKHTARHDIEKARNRVKSSVNAEKDPWDDKEFCAAVRRLSDAEIRLYQLESDDPEDLMSLYLGAEGACEV